MRGTGYGTPVKDELKAMAGSPWAWASVAAGGTGVLIPVTLVLMPRALEIWTRIAQQLNPGVDAPDNWALGITYCLQTSSVLFAGAALLAMVGMWRHIGRGKTGNDASPPS